MMETNFYRIVNGHEYYDVSFLPNQIPDLGFGVPSSSDFDLRLDHHHQQPSYWIPSTQQDQDQDSPPGADEIDSENTLLKYVNQLLMEEETLSENQSMSYDDALALRQTEEMKLRITGVELPQNGFRPTEKIEDTGRRLREYCKRFGVPFEYHALASKNWETIRLEEFKIRPNEVLAVNSVLRFKNLRDVTPGEEDCPRDGFLKLIRDMKPDVFLSSTINGSFNAPFFATRFKEALFHYSSLFDMFGSTLSKENPERMHFEGEFFGREVMNVIACEGVDRVERPETYKQWQVRMMRAGFKQKPVERELVESFREKMKRWGYHKDFVLDQDSNWFLQGWKGRILFSSSCWVPS
ncbi:hypothetical protein DY000_02058090 [Brassica cretica]|uniref:GRAS family transcription factor n=1 Tax=Brassica cretica TaxID=69181 RepID=A0ABQ7AJQ7_BRACR|nr:hypothetical protein DY000_02058090 [Brassica cretica]